MKPQPHMDPETPTMDNAEDTKSWNGQREKLVTESFMAQGNIELDGESTTGSNQMTSGGIMHQTTSSHLLLSAPTDISHLPHGGSSESGENSHPVHEASAASTGESKPIAGSSSMVTGSNPFFHCSASATTAENMQSSDVSKPEEQQNEAKPLSNNFMASEHHELNRESTIGSNLLSIESVSATTSENNQTLDVKELAGNQNEDQHYEFPSAQTPSSQLDGAVLDIEPEYGSTHQQDGPSTVIQVEAVQQLGGASSWTGSIDGYDDSRAGTHEDGNNLGELFCSMLRKVRTALVYYYMWWLLDQIVAIIPLPYKKHVPYARVIMNFLTKIPCDNLYILIVLVILYLLMMACDYGSVDDVDGP